MVPLGSLQAARSQPAESRPAGTRPAPWPQRRAGRHPRRSSQVQPPAESVSLWKWQWEPKPHCRLSPKTPAQPVFPANLQAQYRPGRRAPWPAPVRFGQTKLSPMQVVTKRLALPTRRRQEEWPPQAESPRTGSVLASQPRSGSALRAKPDSEPAAPVPKGSGLTERQRGHPSPSSAMAQKACRGSCLRILGCLRAGIERGASRCWASYSSCYLRDSLRLPLARPPGRLRSVRQEAKRSRRRPDWAAKG